MKRSDLTPGQDYLHSDTQNWESRGYRARRVTVVSAEPVAPARGYRAASRTFTLHDGTTAQVAAVPKGNYSLVRDEKGVVFPALNAHLRGPWQETKAKVDEAEQAKRDRNAREHAAEQAANARVREVEKRITDLGIDTGLLRRDRFGGVNVPVSALEALLDLAENGAH